MLGSLRVWHIAAAAIVAMNALLLLSHSNWRVFAALNVFALLAVGVLAVTITVNGAGGAPGVPPPKSLFRDDLQPVMFRGLNPSGNFQVWHAILIVLGVVNAILLARRTPWNRALATNVLIVLFVFVALILSSWFIPSWYRKADGGSLEGEKAGQRVITGTLPGVTRGL